MRKMILALTAIALIATAVATGLGGAQAAGAADAERQIRKIDRQWVAAVAKKDSRLVAAFYAPDGAILAPGAPAAQGHNAIVKAWEGFFALKDFSLTFEPTKISVAKAGDMAYELGTYSLGFTTDKGRVREMGKYVVVWKKIGKAWKVTADIFNNNGKAP